MRIGFYFGGLMNTDFTTLLFPQSDGLSLDPLTSKLGEYMQGRSVVHDEVAEQLIGSPGAII